MSKETLKPSEHELLKLICDTFIPALESADHPDFYSRRASDISVDRELARIIESELRPEFREQIRGMLRYFENPLFNLALHQKPKGFSHLSHQDRENYLSGWANSKIPLRRTGFQALKRLILFLNYSLPNTEGFNPNWDAIGYHGPPILADRVHYTLPEEKRIKPLTPTTETTLECDACVIGSGAGGSVIASVLSKGGMKIVIMEEGSYNTPETFTQQEYSMMKRLHLEGGTLATKDLSYTLLAGMGGGGGTVVNWMTSLQPPAWILQEWETKYGITELTGPKFTQYIREVEETLHVNTEESQRNPNNDILWQGCQKLGYTENTDFSIIPRNASGCKERCGPCGYGCVYSGKQSTILNYLPDAFQAGARFLFNTRAEHLEIEHGEARGVQAIYHNGRDVPIHIKCRIIVIACGAVNSAALLLRSGIRQNVGRGLLLDPTTAIASIYEKPIEMWTGPMQTVNVTKFLNLDGEHHGFWIEAVPAHPGLIALGLPWLGGRAHKEQMLRISRSAASIILLREKGSGRVTIEKKGAPICEYNLDELDKKNLIEGLVEAARIALAAGSVEVSTLHTKGCSIQVDTASNRDELLEDLRTQIQREGVGPNRLSLFSAHLMGGCAMGKDSSSAVVDPNGQLYGVEGVYLGDASIFPTTPGVNPMITIMAMARRTAEAILEKEKTTPSRQQVQVKITQPKLKPVTSTQASPQPNTSVPRPPLVSLVALLILIGALLAIVAGSVTYASSATFLSFFRNETTANGLTSITLTPNDVANFALILIGYGVLHMAIAYGLWTGQNWARKVSLFLSVVGLLLTLPALLLLPELVLVVLFAVFFLYYFTRPRVKAFFKA
jgi:choline dehydrogenase-like flavoprotein